MEKKAPHDTVRCEDHVEIIITNIYLRNYYITSNHKHFYLVITLKRVIHQGNAHLNPSMYSKCLSECTYNL